MEATPTGDPNSRSEIASGIPNSLRTSGLLSRVRTAISGQSESASFARQTLVLFGVDSATNLIDYVFHIYLGRALPSGDFAIVETVNSALLIAITVLGMVQPVVARHVAESEARDEGSDSSRATFQQYLRFAGLLGLLLSALVWMARWPLAAALRVPAAAIGLSAFGLLLALLRPVVGGMLQGQQRFAPLGLVRTINALGRFAAGWALITLGGGALGAVASLPIASLLALLGGMLFLGPAIWRPAPPAPPGLLWRGLRLSAGAFLAYAAYMSLLNSDLIWVNRSFAPEEAAGYATAVLLRRILALLPGAVIVAMYPRAVRQITRKRLPDKLLALTVSVILGTGAALVIAYFGFGRMILTLTFGERYGWVAGILGWVGLAMCGYTLASIWLNFYLAVRPAPFVAMLVAAAVLQGVALSRYHGSLMQVVAIFAFFGWALFLGGALLYLLWLRPRLVREWYDDNIH